MTSLSAALIQLRTPASQEAALAQAEPLIREAAAKGAALIVTPEGTNILQRDRAQLLPRLRTAEEDACVAGLRRLADELGVWLLIGSALVAAEDGQAVNRALLVSPEGRIAATYDKMHMFDVDLPTGDSIRESASYRAGDKAVAYDLPMARLGLTICYDMRFPYLYRALAKAGADIIAVPSAFTRPTGEAHWEILLRARAIETGSFILAPAQGGRHEDGRGTWGRSIAVGPWGEVLAMAEGDEPGVVMATLDLDAAQKARQAIPALKNERDFIGPGL
ncbi:carbon-nitrogen hydrolase family protein [Phenylobacterium montanum]|uniref:Carbon-nitrogen hydrolase family protein n=1 Tax=Phenylobacterium montanum TaxID=2823693 RepID=A0A975FY86_9CAUL|nr:carbon-nitrogen hydrolase family protein [Caulobacter sp. S6]QUD87409.1 carbon-nitrogen hydrolase family protein [Caulobacter sp. S6]